jgi:hypothetical protein
MKTLLTSLSILLIGTSVIAQTTIKGRVTDTNGEPLVGANIYVMGSYDGTSATENGNFSFKTNHSGTQTVVATFIGYSTQEQNANLSGGEVEIGFELKDLSNQISGVVITAGSFETSERRRSVTLQPLDIVTTPSAAGDIYGALTALPGAATVGEDGRLFVRGGDGYESKTFIDGLLSKKPYSSNVPDLPSRGRFSPFLFSGTTFSTGGYSAEYGQALSSALILTTNSFPEKTQTDISLMAIGGGVTQTLRGKGSSLSIGLEYYNMEPYYQAIDNRFKMNKYPESLAFSLAARQRITNNGTLKVFSTYSGSNFGLNYPNLLQQGAMSDISIGNRNSYTNISYSDMLGENWLLRTGVAFTFDENNLDMESFRVDELNRNVQAKLTLKRSFESGISLLIGVEDTYNYYNQDYAESVSTLWHRSNFNDNNSAAFAEAEIKPLDRIALRAGIRGEHSTLLDEQNVALRISGAYLISQSSQVSVAYGNFYQTPEEELLRFTHNLKFEQANHYIANYQWERDNRIIRVEAYRKDYENLITYNSQEFWNGALYGNEGYGHSQGVDLFFRDRETWSTVDFWVSYSYVNSKRKYRDYPDFVTPHFAPTHTASVVAKRWFQSISTQLGLSSTFATGRPYNNPNSVNFMDGKTPYYHDLSINCSHLRAIYGKSTIFYLSVNNVLGRSNIYGYRYYNQPNASGTFDAIPVRSESNRFYFVGIFVTI